MQFHARTRRLAILEASLKHTKNIYGREKKERLPASEIHCSEYLIRIFLSPEKIIEIIDAMNFCFFINEYSWISSRL